MAPKLPSSSGFFLIGSLWGVGAIAHPCPTCFLGSFSFFARGTMEHVASAKAWMSRVFPIGAE